MSRRRTFRTREKRREYHVEKLESRLKRLESEVRWLQRAVKANGERNGHPVFGPCPSCESGVLATEADRLHCATCGYVRFL